MPTSLQAQKAGERAQRLAEQRRQHRKESSSHSSSVETILAQVGFSNEITRNAPLAPPLHMATTYTRPANGVFREEDFHYTRHDNPTRLLLEREVTKLELHGFTSIDSHVNYSCAFASGMMAVSSIILAHQAPLLVLLPTDLYHGVPTVLDDVFARFNVTTKRIDMQDLEFLLRNSLLVKNYTNMILWMETPSNPQTQVVDIALACRTVKECVSNANPFRCSITTVVDTTLAPLQQPLLLGADIVVQSATKYLGGHSDALCGVATVHPSCAQDLLPKLRSVQTSLGGVASPMDCWLVLRGMKTLAIRYERQCQTALTLAQYFEQHKQMEQSTSVSKVYYPGLQSHLQHDIAALQMKDHYGGVLSVEMASEEHAMAFAGSLLVFTRATSLGGTETLIEHRLSIEPEGKVVSPPGLLRISVGLENVDDLIADVQQALEIMEEACGTDE
ncbi:hypothetical protein MPSEU_000095100 [Mayamaea pseudoterrestris]|nr:hypothetical protein MPSEU_000095100 [Mayamaea pseudoterrestris]